MIGHTTPDRVRPKYKRLRVETTVLLTDEQFDACSQLADALGFDGETRHQRIAAMARAAAEDACYYAHERLED